MSKRRCNDCDGTEGESNVAKRIRNAERFAETYLGRGIGWAA